MCYVSSRATLLRDGGVLVSACDRQHLLHFGSNGEFSGVVGGPGQGPGEFERILNLWTDQGGRIHVFEFKRETVLTPELEHSRTRVVEYLPFDTVFFPDGSSVQQLRPVDQSRGSLPLHTVSPDGGLQRSYGTRESTQSSTQSTASLRAIAQASEQSVWSAEIDRYSIEEWTTEGVPLRKLVRETDWYTGTAPRGERTSVTDLRQDEQGRLWIFVIRPDTEWSGPALAETSGPPLSQVPNEWNQRWDTYIEVIDPVRGELLAARRWDLVAREWLGRFTYTFNEEETTGYEYVDVWEPVLVQHAEGSADSEKFR